MKKAGGKMDRKQKKDQKQSRQNPQKKTKKDPGLPNLGVYKDKMANSLQKKQDNKEQKRQRREEKKPLSAKAGLDSKVQLAQMIFEASRRGEEFEEKQKTIETQVAQGTMSTKEALSGNSRRAYYREFNKVVEAADVIIEVLDARDPLGCRCPEIEKHILSKDMNKRIVLLLNKVDLVPREVVEQWLTYLRNDFPTLAFKCNTQKGNKRQLGQSTVAMEQASDSLLTSGECLGADALMQLLKNYARSRDMKKKISVGIIGYPNVGKSSLINSLKRSRSVAVGPTPGLTKSAQEIHLDSNIRLLDCPGIIFSSGSVESDVTLRNCVKLQTLDDPIFPVELIVRRASKERLRDLYDLSEFTSPQEFLDCLARKQGKLKKGGIPDIALAARLVLNDWNSGKIPFFTMPPVMPAASETTVEVSAPGEVTEDVMLVTEWGKEFQFDDVINREEMFVMSKLSSLSSGKFLRLESEGLGTVDPSLLDSRDIPEEEMGDGGSAASTSVASKPKRKAVRQLQKSEGDEEEEDEEGDAYDFAAYRDPSAGASSSDEESEAEKSSDDDSD